MKRVWKKCACALLSAVLCLPLAGCGGGRGAESYVTGVKLPLYAQGEELLICYPSGERAAALPMEQGMRDFPGQEGGGQENGGEDSGGPERLEGLWAFYGQGLDGGQWAVVCAGPSAGAMWINVLYSEDGGAEWTALATPAETQSEGLLPYFAVIGAGFSSAQRGFLCYRHTMELRPEIWYTEDGGSSWAPLEVPVPQEYEHYHSIQAASPILTGESVCFPVELVDENDVQTICYLSSRDLSHWTWSEA